MRLVAGHQESTDKPSMLGVHGSRWQEIRDQVPEATGAVAGVIVDNPASMLFIACGSYVIGSVLINAVKPRGLPGILACGLMSYGISTVTAAELIRRGILPMRVRGQDGELICLSTSA
jgi:hypothetical protein